MSRRPDQGVQIAYAVSVAVFTPVKAVATQRVPHGGIAVTEPANGRNVHLVFPLQPYQIEIYAPTAGEALQIARTGSVSPIG